MQLTSVRYKHQFGRRFIQVVPVFQQYDVSTRVTWLCTRSVVWCTHLVYVTDTGVFSYRQIHSETTTLGHGSVHVTTNLHHHHHHHHHHHSHHHHHQHHHHHHHQHHHHHSHKHHHHPITIIIVINTIITMHHNANEPAAMSNKDSVIVAQHRIV